MSLAKREDVGTLSAVQVFSVPVSGGPSKLIMTTRGFADPRCARSPASLCLVAEQTDDQRQVVFIAFDPLKGRGPVITRLATEPTLNYGWDLSPDGSEIVISRSRRTASM
jgi:hypothetical protein